MFSLIEIGHVSVFVYSSPEVACTGTETTTTTDEAELQVSTVKECRPEVEGCKNNGLDRIQVNQMGHSLPYMIGRMYGLNYKNIDSSS